MREQVDFYCLLLIPCCKTESGVVELEGPTGDMHSPYQIESHRYKNWLHIAVVAQMSGMHGACLAQIPRCKTAEQNIVVLEVA